MGMQVTMEVRADDFFLEFSVAYPEGRHGVAATPDPRWGLPPPDALLNGV